MSTLGGSWRVGESGTPDGVAEVTFEATVARLVERVFGVVGGAA